MERLEALCQEDWDEDSRISVVVNAPTAPSKPSMLPSALSPSTPGAQWATALILAAFAILGAVRMAHDVLRAVGVLV
jgi:hypothetical protein